MKSLKLSKKHNVKKKTNDYRSKTVIGYGAPNQGTNKIHGTPLGPDGIAATKANYGWEYGPFEVPEEVQHPF